MFARGQQLKTDGKQISARGIVCVPIVGTCRWSACSNDAGHMVAELCKDRHGGAARTPSCSQHLAAITDQLIQS